VLDKKLVCWPSTPAFHVTSIRWLAAASESPDAIVIGRRAWNWVHLDVGIIHDGGGQLQPLRDQEARSLHGHALHGKEQLRAVQLFQDNIAHGKENDWRCRAGARYL